MTSIVKAIVIALDVDSNLDVNGNLESLGHSQKSVLGTPQQPSPNGDFRLITETADRRMSLALVACAIKK